MDSAVANGINNSGAVVGAGYDGTNTKCFIATPKLPTPKVTIITPQANFAVQDGVVFQLRRLILAAYTQCPSLCVSLMVEKAYRLAMMT